MITHHFNAFRRDKGQRIVAEYIVVDQLKLAEADYKHFPDASPFALVSANKEVFKDYQEVMRLCKTYVADPVVFKLCREIEKRITLILERRLTSEGEDRWLFEDKPLPLRTQKEEKPNGTTETD